MPNPFDSDGFDLKPRISFDDLMRRVTDAWLENSRREVSADVICRPVEDLVRINMLLTIVDTAPMSPLDWRVHFVRRYGIPTNLVATDELQESRSLRDFPDQALVSEHIVGVCQKAIAGKKWVSDRIDLVARGLRVVGDRLVVPDLSENASWCVILAEVQSISIVGLDTRFDDTDITIIQLLREGMSAREIGRAIEFSSRTVEHRIERMKVRAKVKTIAALLTMKA
jgi:DNA-binding CsgD family transcriptional regulator